MPHDDNDDEAPHLGWGVVIAVVGIVMILSAVMIFAAAFWPAHAIHYVQNPDDDPAVTDWYAHVFRSDFWSPDSSPSSCCGIADAYWADDYKIRDGKFFAVITDDSTVPGRLYRPLGLEYEVIPEVLDHHFQGNPTGHAVVFITSSNSVICYFFSTGG